VDLARKNNKILMVGHLLRYHPCVRKIQELVSKGSIGNIRYIHCSRKNLGKIRQQENVLWSFAPHDISLVLSLMKDNLPQKITCLGQKHLHPDIHDVTDTFLEFHGNCFAHISVNWLNPRKEQTTTIVGDRGMILFDDTKEKGKKLKICSEYLEFNPGEIPKASKPNFKEVVCDWKEDIFPLYLECEHFIDCCIHRKDPITNGEEGLRVLQVLDACHHQLINGGTGTCFKTKKEKYFRHETSIVDDEAKIGEGVNIWHYSHIMAASIGKKTNIGQNCFVGNHVKLGENCRVQNNVSIYEGVECGNDVFLGPSMVFCNDKNPRAAYSKHGKYMKTIVKNGVTIGANATILPGITLGEQCFIGAGSVVTKDVPAYALVYGNPAKKMGVMDEKGKIVK
jgi:UDP-2-acetamido-3-amino-2,3-dideoxy-glucuronate N-acetyltransferase